MAHLLNGGQPKPSHIFYYWQLCSASELFRGIKASDILARACISIAPWQTGSPSFRAQLLSRDVQLRPMRRPSQTNVELTMTIYLPEATRKQLRVTSQGLGRVGKHHWLTNQAGHYKA